MNEQTTQEKIISAAAVPKSLRLLVWTLAILQIAMLLFGMRQLQAVNDLVTSNQSPTENPQLAALDARLKESEDLIFRLRAELAEYKAAFDKEDDGEALASVSRRIDMLATELREREAVSLPDDAKIDALMNAAKNLEQAETQRAAFILKLQSFERLDERIKLYRPYPMALEAFATAFREHSKLPIWREILAPTAKKGLLQPQQLLSVFERSATAQAPAGDKATSGFGDKLLENIKGLVKIRKVGNPEGSDEDAVLARIRTALHKKAYAKALTEIESLPEASQLRFKDLTFQLAAHQEIMGLMNIIRADLERESSRMSPISAAPLQDESE